MGRHVAVDAPDLDRVVDDACAAIGAEIAAMRIPRLWGVVLGGGYGRGEGGAIEKLESKVGVGEGHDSALELQLETPTLTLSNDLDFFAVAEEGSDDGVAAGIAAALEPVSEKWTKTLGVDVDFVARTPWRMRHDQERVMIQELVHGYFDVAGAKGDELFARIVRRAPEDFPWMEAARLLMNRGMGLLFAMVEAGKGGSSKLELEKGAEPLSSCNSELFKKRDFINRNINKCILGAGDARLIARHAYRWRATERADALGDDLYRAAVEWKFRPRAAAVCDWETARATWLAAEAEVMAAGRASGELGRSLYQAARWIARRKTFGELASTGQDCVVRVLKGIGRSVRERGAPSAGLKKDWETFN